MVGGAVRPARVGWWELLREPSTLLSTLAQPQGHGWLALVQWAELSFALGARTVSRVETAMAPRALWKAEEA